VLVGLVLGAAARPACSERLWLACVPAAVLGMGRIGADRLGSAPASGARRRTDLPVPLDPARSLGTCQTQLVACLPLDVVSLPPSRPDLFSGDSSSGLGGAGGLPQYQRRRTFALVLLEVGAASSIPSSTAAYSLNAGLSSGQKWESDGIGLVIPIRRSPTIADAWSGYLGPIPMAPRYPPSVSAPSIMVIPGTLSSQ